MEEKVKGQFSLQHSQAFCRTLLPSSPARGKMDPLTLRWRRERQEGV